METSKKNNKYYIFLIGACFFLYLMSISVKTVYFAEQVVIMSVFNANKADAGLGITFYYVLYSLVQIYLATLGKKINIGRFTIVTTVLSAISFVLIMFVNAMWQVWLILALNGILQASVWGGCMYFLGKYLPDSWSSVASTVMSFSYVVGTAISYGGAAFFVAVLDWRYGFLFFSVLMLIALVIFIVAERCIKKRVGEREQTEAVEEAEHTHGMLEDMPKKSLSHFFIYFLTVSFLVCCFYYGVSNWMPNLLKEVFGVDESYSILITILMPVGMMFGPVEANRLCNKTGRVFLVSVGFIGIAVAIMLAMIFVYDLNIVLSIVLTIGSLFFLRGIVNLFVSYVPLRMKHVMDAGNSSMLVNAIMCFGAALMPFFTGWFMDNFGWRNYYILLLVMGIATTLSLVVGVVKQGKRKLF